MLMMRKPTEDLLTALLLQGSALLYRGTLGQTCDSYKS